MKIAMLVEALCDDCTECPNLNLVDERVAYYSEMGTTIHHDFRCRNLEGCERVKNFLLKNGEQIRMKEVDQNDI